MRIVRPFEYWAMWMLKLHTITPHYIITSWNEMFRHMDGMMRAWAKMKTQWKEEIYLAVKVPRQTLFKYYAEVTPTTSLLFISVHILDPIWKLRLFRKWDKVMYMNPEDDMSYTTQYQETLGKYVENKYSTKH
jgi:hypothetical protein